MDRRRFLFGLGAAVIAAPAIVRVSSLLRLPVRPKIIPVKPLVGKVISILQDLGGEEIFLNIEISSHDKIVGNYIKIMDVSFPMPATYYPSLGEYVQVFDKRCEPIRIGGRLLHQDQNGI